MAYIVNTLTLSGFLNRLLKQQNNFIFCLGHTTKPTEIAELRPPSYLSYRISDLRQQVLSKISKK